MNRTRKTIIWVAIFAIAMGFLESSVVIYLRELYYPSGFEFPLKPIPVFIARVEFLRELATIIMLVACGIFAGRTRLERFAYFVLAFAVWDFFYYVFLYICLGWPQSIHSCDILFLIPVPWVGPVWAPCLLAFLMIAGALHVIRQTNVDLNFSVSPHSWLIMIAGVFVSIVSFMWDYLAFTYHQNNHWSVLSSQSLFQEIQNYIPVRFNSALFFIGFSFMSSALILSILKPYKK
jgi:hypothetical protein